MGETFDRIKKLFKDTADKTADSADKVADPQTYTNPNNEMKIGITKEEEKNRWTLKQFQNMNQLQSRETRTQALQVTQFNHFIFKI